MAHYCKLDEYNTVVQVVVISDKDENGSEETGINFCRTLFNDPEGVWKKTSYNTKAGKHELGGTPFRLNYGTVGMIYNEELDGFVTERNISEEWVSWELSPTTGMYEPPVPIPTDSYLAEGVEPTQENINKIKYYAWNENNLSWDVQDTPNTSLDDIPISTP